MSVLVTGGSGFIGSHLVELLLSQGKQVTVIDNFSSGRRENLGEQLRSSRLRIVEGDILEQKALRAAAKGAEIIFHLAALVGVGRVVSRPVETLTINETGTLNVLGLAALLGAKVVFASSSEVYGLSEQLPLREDHASLIGPSTVPRWSYAVSKLAGEHAALGYYAKGLPVVILRYFNVYGPRYDRSGYGGVIARFMDQASDDGRLTIYGDGGQSRSFLYVKEAAAATAAAAERKEAEGQILNIGHAESHTIAESAELVMNETGISKQPVRKSLREAYGKGFQEVRHRRPDVEKAARVLGFRARVGLREGLRRTWEWRKRPRGAALRRGGVEDGKS